MAVRPNPADQLVDLEHRLLAVRYARAVATSVANAWYQVLSKKMSRRSYDQPREVLRTGVAAGARKPNDFRETRFG
jgi:hypothetical protein